MKVFVVGGRKSYANWVQDVRHVDRMDKADFVMLTGGEDWHPSYYGEKLGLHTKCNPQRDWFEWQAMLQATGLKKPLVGVCKGSQGLCVFAGGRLIQHQEDKWDAHPMTTFDGKIVHVTSSHHQAQFPYRLTYSDYVLLGWTKDYSSYHLDGENKEIVDLKLKEVEACLYTKINGLALQFHPEYEAMELQCKDGLDWTRGLLDDFMRNKLK